MYVFQCGTPLERCRWPKDVGPVSWRSTTVKWRQFSQSNRHSTIGTRQSEYHEALPSSANVQSHLTSSFADDGNASWYSVCRVPMVEWRLDCENCRHLTVVGLHDTGTWCCSGYRVRRLRYIGSARELARQVSVYSYLVRWQVWSAASISWW